MRMVMSQPPHKHLLSIHKQNGISLITALVGLGMLGAIIFGFNHCTDSVLLKVKVRTQEVNQHLFINYLKNSIDCRRTLVENFPNGLPTNCDNTPIIPYSRSGVRLDGPASPWPVYAAEITCWEEAPVPPNTVGDFRYTGTPPGGLPWRFQYGERIFNHLPGNETLLPVVAPAPEAALQSVHWHIWLTLRVRFLGDNHLPARPWTSIYYGSVAVPDPSGANDRVPWVCDDGIAI